MNINNTNKLATDFEMLREATRRNRVLTKRHGITTNGIQESLKGRKICFSYMISYIEENSGLENGEKYLDVIKKHESNYSCCVYHAIVRETQGSIALLYVSRKKNEWENEFEENGDNEFMAIYIVGATNPKPPVIDSFSLYNDYGELGYYSSSDKINYDHNCDEASSSWEEAFCNCNDEKTYFWEEAFCNCDESEISEAFDNACFD